MVLIGIYFMEKNTPNRAVVMKKKNELQYYIECYHEAQRIAKEECPPHKNWRKIFGYSIILLLVFSMVVFPYIPREIIVYLLSFIFILLMVLFFYVITSPNSNISLFEENYLGKYRETFISNFVKLINSSWEYIGKDELTNQHWTDSSREKIEYIQRKMITIKQELDTQHTSPDPSGSRLSS